MMTGDDISQEMAADIQRSRSVLSSRRGMIDPPGDIFYMGVGAIGSAKISLEFSRIFPEVVPEAGKGPPLPRAESRSELSS